MKRFIAVGLGLLLATLIPAASLAQGKANREAEMARVVKGILAETREPRQVARLLSKHGARFLGYRQTTVSFVHTGETVVPTRSAVTSVGPDFQTSVSEQAHAEGISPAAGNKADLTMTTWMHEWRNSDGTYTEQMIVSGTWSDTEYSWIDDPADVIDVRWIVGDLVMSSSSPQDGIQRDQSAPGIASFTVGDQVASWDLFVNFRPTSPAVYGRWTNVFFNYPHTWWGVKLGIQLGGGPTGSTGTITINTDAKLWVEGSPLDFQIGSGGIRGPIITGASEK
ncbi:MAG TPA: hypothetical protein VD902_07500 [Symbiobacteriaceae bacterium]|nr:hypothetical protein [Symbiobacteriaceae bacterium]